MRLLYFAIASAIVFVATWGGSAWAQATGALVIVSDPPGAQVSIDGEAVGAAPVKRTLLPGDHLVEAKFAQGKASQVVKVAAGQSAVVNLTPPVGTSTAPASTGTTTAPPPPPPSTSGTTTPPPPPPPGNEETTSTEKPRDENALVDVTPTSGVARIEGDVLSPAHAHRRLPWGFGAGLGFGCSGAKLDTGAGFKTDNSGCAFLIHLVPWDYTFVEMNIDLLFGGAGPFGIDGGFAIGSPWFQAGPASSPVVMAVRARFAYILQTLPINSYGGIEGGVQVQGSYALTRFLTIDAELTGGPMWAYPLGGGSSKDTIGWFFQLAGGVRL